MILVSLDMRIVNMFVFTAVYTTLSFQALLILSGNKVTVRHNFSVLCKQSSDYGEDADVSKLC